MASLSNGIMERDICHEDVNPGFVPPKMGLREAGEFAFGALTVSNGKKTRKRIKYAMVFSRRQGNIDVKVARAPRNAVEGKRNGPTEGVGDAMRGKRLVYLDQLYW